MTIESKTRSDSVLDQDVIELLGTAVAPVELAPQRLTELRDRVMASIDAQTSDHVSFQTIRADEGPWVEIGPLIHKKVLNVDEETGLESYLLRLQPGAEPVQHRHDEDELCIVLEGDVSFDTIHLKAGDYHFARKGSSHGRAKTVHGAIIFLQSVLGPTHALA